MRFGKFLLTAIGISLAISFVLFPLNTLAALDDGLVGYYPLDGNVNDLSPFANNGSAYGATLTTDRNGNPDSAYAFDGISNYLFIPQSAPLNLNSDGFAISFFIRIDPEQAYSSFSIFDKFNQYDCFATITGWTFLGVTNSNLAIVYGDATYLGYTTIQGPSILDDQWHHVVVMTNNNQLFFYIDGQLFSTQDLQRTPASNIAPIYIGKWACGNSRFFHGAIDDIRFYNRALTESEIAILNNPITENPPVDPVPPADSTTLRPISNTDLVIQSVSVDPNSGEVTIKATLNPASSAWLDINSTPDIRVTVEVQSNDGIQTYGPVGEGSVSLFTDGQNNLLNFGDAQPMSCESEDNKIPHHHRHKHRKHSSRNLSNHSEHGADEWWEQQFKKYEDDTGSRIH